MLKIVRGRIYHNIMDELSDLILSLIGKIDDYDKVEEFEKKFAQIIGVKYAKTLPFARIALFEILKYYDLPKGSEIIMPPITIKPMVDIVIMLGLKPVFVDIELDTFCFDLEELKKSINENTRAILVTYLFGMVPEMDKLLAILRKNNILVIEDFSHTLNASYQGKIIGTLGDVSFYSSSSLKTVDTYIGGTVFTNDEQLHIHLNNVNQTFPTMPRIFLFKKILLNFARNLFSRSVVFTFITNPLLNFIKGLNPTIHKKILGARLNLKPVTKMPQDWTYRYTSLQAKRGLEQLSLVHSVDTAKISNVHSFRKIIGEKFLKFLPKELDGNKNVYWQYPIYTENVDEFITYLNQNDIDAGLTNLSLCSHLDIYPEYMNLNAKNAFTVKYNYVFMPMYQGLNISTIEHISNTVKIYLESKQNDTI